MTSSETRSILFRCVRLHNAHCISNMHVTEVSHYHGITEGFFASFIHKYACMSVVEHTLPG